MSSSVYRSTRIKRPWPSGPRQNCLCNWLTFCEVFLATTRHHINICAQTDCCYERSGLEMVGFCDLVFKENVSGDWPYKGSTSQYWGVLGGCHGVVNLLCSWYTVTFFLNVLVIFCQDIIHNCMDISVSINAMQCSATFWKQAKQLKINLYGKFY